MDDISRLLPVLPILLGLSGHFGIFIDTRKEFGDRVKFLRETLRENLAVILTDLLHHVRTLEDGTIRGEGGNSPDLVKRYTGETWRTFSTMSKIARLHALFRITYFVLFVSTVSAVCLGVGSLAAADHWAVLRKITVGLLAVQIVAIVLIYLSSDWLENHEQNN